MPLYSGIDWVRLPCLVSLRGFGLWLWGFGLRVFGASGLHGFGIEVDSCVYAGNGGNDIGYRMYNFPFAIILITNTGERGGSKT